MSVKTTTIAERGPIPAPASQVYAILSDYRNGHPRILPARYFSDFKVEQGGRGAGTVMSFVMHAFGGKQRGRMTASEPEPGRVLREIDETGRFVTDFTVTPHADGRGCSVEIATAIALPRGPLGALQRWLLSGYLRRVYRAQLQLLAEVTSRS